MKAMLACSQKLKQMKPRQRKPKNEAKICFFTSQKVVDFVRNQH